jgi:signal transduction histidine kinase
MAMTNEDLEARDGREIASEVGPGWVSEGPASSIRRHARKDGSLIDVEIRGHVIDYHGRRAQISLMIDVTEQRQLEAQLREAAKIEAVGQLAGGIAHDFNNVLTAVNGYADLLATELGDDPRAEDAREIGRAGHRAVELTRQLLAFARRQKLAPRPVDVNAVVANVIPMLMRLISEDITLVTCPADGPAVVEVDPSQLEQVLVNLAINARDAMPGGGQLTIATAIQKADYRRRHHLRGPAVLLTVADSGSGMSRDVLSRIFEPFFTTKALTGTGLGLATVHGIVSQSGGEIWADSSVGKGTTFSILLPRSDRHPMAAPEIPQRLVSSDAGSTILVVEDDPEVRRFAVRTLEHHGHNVLVAASPSQGMALAESGDRIDLLLTDLVMPGGSGRDLAHRLLALRPELAVLFMSGYEAEHAIDLTEDGRSGFLAKPFGPDQLITRVREALSR